MLLGASVLLAVDDIIKNGIWQYEGGEKEEPGAFV